MYMSRSSAFCMDKNTILGLMRNVGKPWGEYYHKNMYIDIKN